MRPFESRQLPHALPIPPLHKVVGCLGRGEGSFLTWVKPSDGGESRRREASVWCWVQSPSQLCDFGQVASSPSASVSSSVQQHPPPPTGLGESEGCWHNAWHAAGTTRSRAIFLIFPRGLDFFMRSTWKPAWDHHLPWMVSPPADSGLCPKAGTVTPAPGGM